MRLRLFCGAVFLIALSACTELDSAVGPMIMVVTVPIVSGTPAPAKLGGTVPKPVPAPTLSEPVQAAPPVVKTPLGTTRPPPVLTKAPEPIAAPVSSAVSGPALPEPAVLAPALPEPALPEPALPEPALPEPAPLLPPVAAATPSNPTQPGPTQPGPTQPGPTASEPIRATDVYLNHYCLLSDHSNLCSRTAMHPDWPGHSLKLESMNGTGRSLIGTLVIEYDTSKIEPAADGHLRHSVNQSLIRFEKSPGKLIIKRFVLPAGKDYQYVWNRVKPNAGGMVFGKATFSWQQDNQIKYVMGCYGFKVGSEGGNDNIQGLERGKFNGYGGMDCGAPSIPD
jgi:hypothetical protein